MPSFGRFQGEDPLGVGVQSRGMNRRMNFAQQNPGTSFGPLPSPMWEGLFQALQERGVDELAGGNVDYSTAQGMGMSGSNAFTGQKFLSGRNRAGEIGPQGFAPATGRRGLLPGYGAPDDRNQITNGLHQAYRPGR